jgi:hypothetical protein
MRNTTTETMFDHHYNEKASCLDAAYERSAISTGLVRHEDAKFPENRPWIAKALIADYKDHSDDTKVNDIQFGGTHYKKYGDLQPWDVITKWKLGYLDGTALKYIARWRDKGGIEDLEKAIHFLRKTIEVEKQKNG